MKSVKISSKSSVFHPNELKSNLFLERFLYTVVYEMW